MVIFQHLLYLIRIYLVLCLLYYIFLNFVRISKYFTLATTLLLLNYRSTQLLRRNWFLLFYGRGDLSVDPDLPTVEPLFYRNLIIMLCLWIPLHRLNPPFPLSTVPQTMFNIILLYMYRWWTFIPVDIMDIRFRYFVGATQH